MLAGLACGTATGARRAFASGTDKKHELSIMDGNGTAAEQAEECQFLKAQCGIAISAATSRHAAAALISPPPSICYRQKAEGPIVARAEPNFATPHLRII